MANQERNLKDIIRFVDPTGSIDDAEVGKLATQLKFSEVLDLISAVKDNNVDSARNILAAHSETFKGSAPAEMEEAVVIEGKGLHSIDWPDEDMARHAENAIRHGMHAYDAYSHVYSMTYERDWMKAHKDELIKMFAGYGLETESTIQPVKPTTNTMGKSSFPKIAPKGPSSNSPTLGGGQDTGSEEDGDLDQILNDPQKQTDPAVKQIKSLLTRIKR